jgi:hypothetical protein
MSKLEQLIAELCPNGVEFKTLGEIVNILDSQRKPVAKKNRSTGKYPSTEQLVFKTMLASISLTAYSCLWARTEALLTKIIRRF